MSVPTPALIKKQLDSRKLSELQHKESSLKPLVKKYSKRGKTEGVAGPDPKKAPRQNRSRTSSRSLKTHQSTEESASTKDKRHSKLNRALDRGVSLQMTYRPFFEHPSFRIFANGVLSSEEQS